jgi:hypothetical protein
VSGESDEMICNIEVESIAKKLYRQQKAEYHNSSRQVKTSETQITLQSQTQNDSSTDIDTTLMFGSISTPVPASRQYTRVKTSAEPSSRNERVKGIYTTVEMSPVRKSCMSVGRGSVARATVSFVENIPVQQETSERKKPQFNRIRHSILGKLIRLADRRNTETTIEESSQSELFSDEEERNFILQRMMNPCKELTAIVDPKKDEI